MLEYRKSKIYKLQCEDGHFYIGSTCNELQYRFAQHKTASKTDQRLVYTHINRVGWNTVHIVLVEQVVCENKQQLLQVEDRHIRQHQNNILCLNTNFAVRTKEDVQAYQKAYYQENNEEMNAYQKAYYQETKEEQKVYGKAYRETHTQEQKAYREAHKEQRKVYDKARYEAQKKT